MNALLIINSGSSTIKFSLFSIKDNTIEREYLGIIDRILDAPTIAIKGQKSDEKFSEAIALSGNKESYYQQAIEYILRWVAAKGFVVIAAGHRIVHGGPFYAQPILIDDVALEQLMRLVPAMPLHQPFNIKGVKVLQEKLPHIPQVACFDTSFHATCNPIAQHYALAKKYTETGFRRYGFHGLSYEYVATQLPLIMPAKEAQGKFVVAHLGNGATMCAIDKLKSVATSIGFTGIGGLPMGTRCDSIDPGAVLYLMDIYGFNTSQMRQIFFRESGLLGVSGISSDMRDLLASDKPEAKLAVDIFVHRVYTHAGMLAAELHGLDGLIFTGGIGENATAIRKMVCRHLAWLGVKLDDDKNQQKITRPTKISVAQNGRVGVWVVPSDEDTMIAKHTFNLTFAKSGNKKC